MQLIKVYDNKAVFVDGCKIIIDIIPQESKAILDYYYKIAINDI